MEDKKINYYSTSLLIFYKYTIVYLSRNLANNITTKIIQNLVLFILFRITKLILKLNYNVSNLYKYNKLIVINYNINVKNNINHSIYLAS